MNIAFLTSIRGSKQYGESYSAIVNNLVKKGHIVSHRLSTTDDILANWSQQKREEFFNNFYKKVGSSDLVVAECSHPTINLGYEISTALQHNKEVIILRCDRSDVSITNFDPIYLNKNVYVYVYTPLSLPRVLEEALHFKFPDQYKKFNILLPPQMITKLNIVSKKKCLPKSVYIRGLIEEGLASENVE